jgi:hypothetical protein
MIKLVTATLLSVFIRSEDLQFGREHATEVKMETIHDAFTEHEDVQMKEVPAEEFLLEKVDLNIKGSHYVSDEIKDAENFKNFYNNTYIYVSFRERFIAHNLEEVSETKSTVR